MENPEKTEGIIFSKSQTAIRAEPALSLYYPHIKFFGITFDNRMTFTKKILRKFYNTATKNFTV